MNKKKSVMTLTTFCMVLALTVLSFPGTSAAQSSLPPVLNLATHPLGSKYNALGSGIGTVLSSHLSTEFKVMPTGGPAVWLPMIRSEEVDLGVANSWESKMGYLAAGPYNKVMNGVGSPIRLLCNGSPNLNGVIVAANSDIKTGNDLRGKRFVGSFSGSAAMTAQAAGALANFGLTPKDVKFISVPGVSDGVKAIIEGRADASGAAVIGMSIIAELEAKRGARFLSFDPSPAAAERYADIFPAVPGKVVPGPKKIGVREATYLMEYDTYLVGSKSLSDEVAYQVVKTLWVYNEELWPIHEDLKSWTTNLFVTKNATVPYHPGAIKFYKEKGVWNADMDQVQSRLLNTGK